MTPSLLGWFAVVVLPVLVGLAASRAPTWVGPTAALALALVTLAWDALPPPSELLLPLALAGLAALAARGGARVAMGLGVGGLLFLLVGEGAARVALDPPPEVHGSDDPPWASRARRRGHDARSALEREACEVAFSDPGPRPHPWVLHLGDSMVQGPFTAVVPDADPSSAQRPEHAPDGLGPAWDEALPEVTHGVRAAVGTSVDVGRMALSQALPHRPDLVLWYVYPFNDALELGETWPCCPDGPLLEDVIGPPRCERPAPVEPTWIQDLQRTADPPWMLRALAPHSRLAGWLVVAWVQSLQDEPFRPARTWSDVAAVLADGVAAARQAGVPVRLVLLPDTGRRVLMGEDGDEALVRDALRDAGLADLVLEPILGGDDALGKMLMDDGVHFDARGRAQLVEALRPAVRSALGLGDAGGERDGGVLGER